MIINGLEVNYGNLSNWSARRLWHLRHQLRLNIRDGMGNTSEEQLLAKLMTVEINRQSKIINANILAKRKKEKLMAWKPTEKWA